MSTISKETLVRLPSYLRFLKELDHTETDTISSSLIAERFNLNPVLVRKDLASVSADGGKPKTGFSVSELIADISDILGYNNTQEAILVGVGKLGSALLGYQGFSNYGLKIVAAFDSNKDIISSRNNGVHIYDIKKLPTILKRLMVHIGIITAPAEYAQEICDIMIKSGIKAVWNFSPTNLVVPCDIAIKNEDMAASLAVLSQRLSEILKKQN